MESVDNTYDNLPYDKTLPSSIFEYSKNLLGKTLRDFLNENYVPKKGKGGIGQMVENLFFLLQTNNNPEADFSSAGLELKCTPIKWNKSQQYIIKERLVCNMINYCEVVNEDFEHSHFYQKCQLMLLLFYLYESNVEILDLKFIFSLLWHLPEKDLYIIKQDYDTIIQKIRRGEAHLLSEGDTMYLGACRKGQKGDSLMQQPNSELGAPRRAFCLKMAYMRTVLQYVLDTGKTATSNYDTSSQPLVMLNELKSQTFEEIILQRFRDYLGKDYLDIAKIKDIDLSRNPKNKFSLIANAMVTTNGKANVNRSEEFTKAGLTMKTIRVQYNGNIKEAMSFENIDYMEVAESKDWYNSRLYELFSSRFMFVIFKEQHCNAGDYILDKVFFWTMPQDDLDDAEEYWKHIRENVLQNHFAEEYWWKGKDRKKFHVRPKGKNSSDLAETPYGTFAKKFCYWFNNDYVTQIVNSNGAK